MGAVEGAGLDGVDDGVGQVEPGGDLGAEAGAEGDGDAASRGDPGVDEQFGEPGEGAGGDFDREGRQDGAGEQRH